MSKTNIEYTLDVYKLQRGGWTLELGELPKQALGEFGVLKGNRLTVVVDGGPRDIRQVNNVLRTLKELGLVFTFISRKVTVQVKGGWELDERNSW